MAVRKSFQRPDAFLDKEMSDHEENLSDKEESDDNDEGRYYSTMWAWSLQILWDEEDMTQGSILFLW